MTPQPRRTPVITVVEIAKHANVSPATVSRVINQPDKVSPALAQAVREAMQELNYTPSPLSNRRGPKSRLMEAKSIGVWFVGAHQTPSMNWFVDLASQSNPSMTRRPIDMSMFVTETNLEIPKPIRQGEIDGVIIQGMVPAPESWAILNQMPTLWFMTRRSLDYPGDYLEPDNICNGRMAADYLASKGHQHLAVINVEPDYSAIAIRTESFLERSRQLQLKVEVIEGEPAGKEGFLDSHPREDKVIELVNRYARMNPRPTGVYLPDDHFCGTFLRAVWDKHLRPDQDFDLILGNKSLVIYPHLGYQPTAIDINLHTLVKKAIDHLIWRIDNPDQPGRVGISIAPSLFPAPVVPPGIPRFQIESRAGPVETDLEP